jgi:hypothetical protein
MTKQPTIRVIEGSIAELRCDVIALKFAQEYYGADRLVASLLAEAGEDPDHLRPRPGGYRLLSGRGVVGAEKVLFVGVPPLREFGYKEIRGFARKVLTAVAGELPTARSIAATLHGPGYGLDEIEAFESEIAGFLDAISSADTPAKLEDLIVVERNPGRCARLQRALGDLLPEDREAGTATVVNFSEAREERLRAVGYASSAKAHVFVAMPFRDETDDVYHYGIQGAVRDAGFLCERADLATFTGDVLQWVKDRIKTCSLLVADLSDANPNVYLEVGYAWGCGVPTVLLVRDTASLQFDVRGQRCLIYKRIKDLEGALRKALQSLGEPGDLARRR